MDAHTERFQIQNAPGTWFDYADTRKDAERKAAAYLKRNKRQAFINERNEDGTYSPLAIA